MIRIFYAVVYVFFMTHSAVAGSIPIGYLLMCLQNQQECKSSGPSEIAVSDGLFTLLYGANRTVNSHMVPRSDEAGQDVWSVGVRYGDCEDFALAKRRELLRANLPSAAIRIVVAKTASGEAHALLAVNTNQGLFALDNLRDEILPLNQTGYKIVSIQTSDPYKWE